LSQGIVIGKIIKMKNVGIPQEILFEPIELGTPGAYVASVASNVYSRAELDGLWGKGQKHPELSPVYTTTEESQRAEGIMSIREDSSDTTRYCLLKVLNTRGQLLELGKHIRLGVAEHLLLNDARNPEVVSGDTDKKLIVKEFR
jgi:hypothetical protein